MRAFHFPAVGGGEGDFVLAAGCQALEQFVVAAFPVLELRGFFLQGGADRMVKVWRRGDAP